MKSSTNSEVLASAKPFLDAGIEIQALSAALENLRNKKEILTKELDDIDERLAASERQRPALLEAVLAGAQEESVLTNQEVVTTQLGAARKSKTSLLELIGRQLEEKSAKQKKTKDLRERSRGMIYRSIEQDLIANMPEGFLPYMSELSAVAQMNSRSLPTLIEELAPSFGHDAHRALMKNLFSRYDID